MQTLKMEPNKIETLPLKELVAFSLGGDWGKSPDEKLDDYVKVKVVRGTEFGNWWKNKASTAALRQIKKSSLEKRQLKKGDLIVEVSGGGPTQPVGRVIVIDDEALSNSDYPLVCSNFSRQIRLKEGFASEFVRLSIYLDYLSGKINLYQTSTTNLRNLNFNDFLDNIEIPSLPLEAQEIIAKQMNTSADQINSVKQRISKTKSLINKFRQAIVSAAIEGRLTENFRKTDSYTEVNSLTTKDEYKIEVSDEILLFDLPDNWKWSAVGNCADVIDPQPSHRTPPTFENGVPYVGMGDINADGSINFGKARKVSPEVLQEHKKRYVIKDGDFIFGKIGTLGKPVLLPVAQEYTLSANIVLVQPKEYKINARYLYYFLASEWVKIVLTFDSHATSQPAFGIKRLRTFPIPLPPVEEQNEIAQTIKRYFEITDQIERQIHKAEQKTSKLNQAVLNKYITK